MICLYIAHWWQCVSVRGHRVLHDSAVSNSIFHLNDHRRTFVKPLLKELINKLLMRSCKRARGGSVLMLAHFFGLRAGAATH